MEEDLGKEGIELKPKKPRSDAQVKAFEKAREIRMENSKIKKEKIAQVKEEVKNRNKVEKPMVSPTTPSLPKEEPKIDMARGHRGTAVPLELSDDEPDIVVVKKKKKPKVIYIEESDDEPPPKQKKTVEQPLEQKIDKGGTPFAVHPPVQPVLVKPTTTIRFC